MYLPVWDWNHSVPGASSWGGNTETIATHLREAHYQLAIACDLHKVFASMSVQVTLEHCSGCKDKLHKRKSKVKKQEKASYS